MRTLREIENTIIKHKDEIKEKYKVKEIGIFGSHVTGKDTRKSDIDILVDFKEPVSLLILVRLENYLSDLLRKKVDLVPKRDIRPELKKRILKEVVYL